MDYFIGGVVTGIFIGVVITGFVAVLIWAHFAFKDDKKTSAKFDAEIAEINAANAAMEARNAQRRAELGLPAKA